VGTDDPYNGSQPSTNCMQVGLQVVGMSQTSTQLEPFVDPPTAAGFLAMKPRQLLELARAGILPGHPIGPGKRHSWRFRLSELAASVASRVDSRSAVPGGQKAKNANG
jgi:hypothetical protein